MSGRRFTYRSMTPKQFNAALESLGMPRGYKFARLYGAAPTSFQRWASGEKDIPHSVTLVLALLTLPGAMQMAESVFDEMNTGVSEAETKRLTKHQEADK